MIERDVIVVAAAPVGMTAALALRGLGRPVTVVEAGDQSRVRPGSRAIFIHGATLQILERIQPGLGHELNRHGLTWRTKRTLYRGREVFAKTYPRSKHSGLPAATSLPQVVTEKLLYQACLGSGVEFIWNSQVTKASADANRVELETVNGDRLAARYVIASDGSRSAVRESSGLKLQGPQTTNAFVIVDAAEDPANPLPVERVFHYEHPAVEHRSILYVPFAGHWRIDMQCHPNDDPESFSGIEGTRKWLPKVIRADYADRVTWVSTYIFRQAVCNSFTDSTRRILLAGEAAHVFAPFGARGLNSGVPDAFLAAKAVDKALNAGNQMEADAVVDHFAQSRRAAALRNRESSNIALRHLTASTPLSRVKRRIAAALSPILPGMGRWLDRAPYGPPLGPPDSDGMQY